MMVSTAPSIIISNVSTKIGAASLTSLLLMLSCCILRITFTPYFRDAKVFKINGTVN